MTPKRVLLLDDDLERHEAVRRNKHAAFLITHVHSVEEAKAALIDNPPFDIWSLDHDLSEGDQYCDPSKPTLAPTGTDFVKWVTENFPPTDLPDVIVVHSWNPAGAMRMWRDLSDYCDECNHFTRVLRLPFDPRAWGRGDFL